MEVLKGLFILLMMNVANVKSHWWSMSVRQPTDDVVYKRFSACETVGLSRNQKALCIRYYSHMGYVSSGAATGIRECQRQFQRHRWNCSTVQDSSVFGKVIKTGSKETAFTYAIASAGVLYEVAKACRGDSLSNCGCSENPRPERLHDDWVWGKCGDDTEYAYGFAREFVDAHERDNLSPKGKKNKARKQMNLHNNEAGRMMVVQLTRPSCKCHGVSGSCNLKTCWMQLPKFREVGNKLLKKHQEAISASITRRGRLKARRFSKSNIEITDLVYVESSPDYCKNNRRTGVSGTRGRECKLDSREMDGCGLLCCGRGYRTKTIEEEYQCNCKFQWCCNVNCETCTRRVKKHFCK